MRCIPQMRFIILFFLIPVLSFAQSKNKFKYKDECFKLLIKANTIIRTERDTVAYHNMFNKIDSLTLLEGEKGQYVKYSALRGAILSGNGYLKEGLKYNQKAVEYGEKHLPKNSSRLAVAYGNLGYTYNKMGEIDLFILNTFKSNGILLTNAAKNASDLIQTNLNLEPYLANKPEVLFTIQEQNDSLIKYLSERNLDVKAFYHVRKSKHALFDNNFRESKIHIGKAIKYFNQTKETKLNLKKHYYSAIAMNSYLLKDYKDAIANYKTYMGLIKSDNTYDARAYLYNQISNCFKGLNETDSALAYVYKAYEEVKLNKEESKKHYAPSHAIEVLNLNYEVNKAYDLAIYRELDKLSGELIDLPIYYMEYAKIRARVNKNDSDFYVKVLHKNIDNAESNVFKSYYVAKLAEYHFNKGNLKAADSLFDTALHLNQVMPEKTNSLLYNSNLIKTFVEFKYQILHQNMDQYSDLEILIKYDVLIKNLLAYVYENWNSTDRDKTLEEIQVFCNEAIKFCYAKNKDQDSDIPFFEYALYFSDQSKSILFKYNQRRIMALENSSFSKEKLSKLKYYKSKLDAYIYGDLREVNKKDLLEIQAYYNDLLVEAQTSKSAFVETESFYDFTSHLNKVIGKYDEIFVFHSLGDEMFKMAIHSGEISKLNLSKEGILKHQNIMFTSMVEHNVSQYEKSAYTLFQSFFGNGFNAETNNVLIVNAPDLLPIPFEGLVQSINQKSFNKLDYLVSDYVFTYNQGLSADYDYRKDFDLSVPYVGVYSEKGNNLHFAKSEIKGVNAMLKGEVYNVDEHEQSEILDRLKLAQVIHIATHSEIDSLNAYSSQLVFGDDSSNVNLKYYEIMNMDINPNLLVLNACSTGNGKYKIGEGKISMARAFNYAGAHNVLVNSWDVSDFSVKKIMESFFRFYNKRNEVAEALQLSKKDYLEQSDDLTGNPLFWAGTIFVSSSHVSSHEYMWSLGLGVLLLSISFISLAYFRSKK